MIAENGTADVAFLLDAAFSPEDETVRSRIARSLFVLSTGGLNAFASPAGRFRDGCAGATPQGRGWRGRRRREAKPTGFGHANGGDRANRARRDVRAPVFARKKQKGTPQLPQISVPRDAPQKAKLSKGRSRSDAEGARQRPRGFHAFRGRKQTRIGLSADRISGFQKNWDKPHAAEIR